VNSRSNTRDNWLKCEIFSAVKLLIALPKLFRSAERRVAWDLADIKLGGYQRFYIFNVVSAAKDNRYAAQFPRAFTALELFFQLFRDGTALNSICGFVGKIKSCAFGNSGCFPASTYSATD
jgi:hypothetical protein